MRRAVLLAAVAFGTASAQRVQVWESFDAPVLERGRVTTVLHTQFRARANLRDYFQARFGPVLRMPAGRGFGLIAGYYFGEVEQKAGWGNNHRTFGGVERPVGAFGGTLNWRSMLEHHFGGEDAPEVRHRHQAQLVRRIKGRMSAILSAETFFDQHGFFQQRWLTGARLPFIGRYRVDVTYMYDQRIERAGPGRHVFQAAFRPNRRPRPTSN